MQINKQGNKMRQVYDVALVEPIHTITRFDLIESKTYKPPWVRSYNLNATYTDMNNIQSVIERGAMAGNLKGIGNAINYVNPNMMEMSHTPSKRADIIGGWDESRFKFTLVLESKYPNRDSIIVNYVQGYSDYKGISYNDTLDPTMNLNINNVIVLRKSFMNGTPVVTQTGSYNVLKDEFNNVGANPVDVLMRPEDIVSNITTLMSTSADNVTIYNDASSIRDTKVVDKKMTIPVNHLGKTLEAAVTSKTDTNNAFNENGDNMYSMLGDLLTPSVDSLNIFKLLSSIGKFNTKSFTIDELKSVMPPDSVSATVWLDSGLRTKIPNNILVPNFVSASETADLHDASYETRVAYLTHSVVAQLLEESTLSDIMFTIHNIPQNGMANPHMSDCPFATSFISGLNTEIQKNNFINSFINKAWASITNNQQSIVSLSIVVMEGNTMISLSLDGRDEVVYKFPTFADSQFTPLLCTQGALDTMSEGYGDIITTALGTLDNQIIRNSPNNNFF